MDKKSYAEKDHWHPFVYAVIIWIIIILAINSITLFTMGDRLLPEGYEYEDVCVEWRVAGIQPLNIYGVELLDREELRDTCAYVWEINSSEVGLRSGNRYLECYSDKGFIELGCEKYERRLVRYE